MRLGVDIGGTAVKFLVIDNNEFVYKWQMPTNKESTEGLVDSLAAECNRICKEYPITQIGFGFPGSIRDGLATADNLPLKSVPFLRLLEERIDLPLSLDNDANCAALAEIKWGNTNNYNNIVLVTLGTGIGGGVVLDGKIYRGIGYAGEVGHITVGGIHGHKCNCGLRGCWEQHASATALVRDAKLAAEKNKNSLLYSILKERGDSFNGKSFFEAFNQGCPVAESVFSECLDWLATGVVSILYTFDPDAVILAGGITRQGEKFISELRKRVFAVIDSKSKIEVSQFQDDAGAIGAALL